MIACGEGETRANGPISRECSTANAGTQANVERFVETLASAAPADSTVHRSVAELSDAADVVIRARFLCVKPGREIYGSAADDEPAFRTVAFEIELLEVVGGDQPDLVSGRFMIEAQRPQRISIEDLDALLPVDAEALLFLSDYTTPSGPTEARAGQADTRYLFPLEQGLILDMGDQLVNVSPFLGVEGARSLDDVVAAIPLS